MNRWKAGIQNWKKKRITTEENRNNRMWSEFIIKQGLCNVRRSLNLFANQGQATEPRWVIKFYIHYQIAPWGAGKVKGNPYGIPLVNVYWKSNFPAPLVQTRGSIKRCSKGSIRIFLSPSKYVQNLELDAYLPAFAIICRNCCELPFLKNKYDATGTHLGKELRQNSNRGE